jgi:hypothetical protein
MPPGVVVPLPGAEVAPDVQGAGTFTGHVGLLRVVRHSNAAGLLSPSFNVHAHHEEP